MLVLKGMVGLVMGGIVTLILKAFSLLDNTYLKG
jgi:hypothetical protein